MADQGLADIPTTYYYTGYVEDGIPNGSGEMHFDDIIIWRNSFTGETTGRAEEDIIVKYTGNFENGKLEGYGVKTFNDYLQYEGNFKNGLYDGEGKSYYSLTNVMQMSGTFSNGKANGYMDTYDINGVFTGFYIFENGVSMGLLTDGYEGDSYAADNALEDEDYDNSLAETYFEYTTYNDPLRKLKYTILKDCEEELVNNDKDNKGMGWYNNTSATITFPTGAYVYYKVSSVAINTAYSAEGGGQVGLTNSEYAQGWRIIESYHNPDSNEGLIIAINPYENMMYKYKKELDGRQQIPYDFGGHILTLDCLFHKDDKDMFAEIYKTFRDSIDYEQENP